MVIFKAQMIVLNLGKLLHSILCLDLILPLLHVNQHAGLQAESVAQLVSARTPAAAGSALAGLQGGIGSVIGSLRMEAIALLAEFEVSSARSQDCLILTTF